MQFQFGVYNRFLTYVEHYILKLSLYLNNDFLKKKLVKLAFYINFAEKDAKNLDLVVVGKITGLKQICYSIALK